MHTLQWIAYNAHHIEAELDGKTVEQRLAYIGHSLQEDLDVLMGTEYNTSAWYDWFVVGGGRWNPEDTSGYNLKTNMFISYDTDPDKFTAKIAELVENRKTDYFKYLSEIDFDTVKEKLNNYNGNIQFESFMDFYPLKQCIAFNNGIWGPDSKFFDIDTDSTNTEYCLNNLDKDGYLWYLIPVDFHF